MKSFRKISALLVTVLALALFLAILPISAAAEDFASDEPVVDPTVWLPETETGWEPETESVEDTWEETATMEPGEPGWDPYPITTIYSEGVKVPMSDEIYEETVYCYEIMARGEAFSSFMMSFSLPYFAEVREVVADQMLLDAWNGVFEYYAENNTVSVSFSSAFDFSDVTLFYVYFTVNDYSEQTGWVDCYGYQLVNENAELVEVTFELGAIEIRPDVIKGDVNGDGVVDLADLLIIQRSIVNPNYELDELQWRAADIDENGCVDMLDCQYIQSYLIGRIADLESVGGACRHFNTWSEISELSCTANSYQFIFCYDCGVLVSEKLVEHALGHDFEKGWCVRCGEAEDAWGDIVDPEECKHEFLYEEHEATCTDFGYVVKRCSLCAYVSERNEFAPLGHDFVDGWCTRCNEQEYGDVERVLLYSYRSKELTLKLYSDDTVQFTETVYTADGSVLKETGESKWHESDGRVYVHTYSGMKEFLLVDGKLIPYTETESCEHMNIYADGYDATCTEWGLVRDVCYDCGEICHESSVEPLGHMYYNGICDRCGEYETDIPEEDVYVKYVYATDEVYIELYSNYTLYCTAYDRNADGMIEVMEGSGKWNDSAEGRILAYIEGQAITFVINENGMLSLQGDGCTHMNTTYTDGIGATCEAGGHIRELCWNCGTVLSEYFEDALGHEFLDDTCVRCGYMDDAYVGGDDAEPEGCKHEKTYVAESEASCTSDGSQIGICAMCKEILWEKTVSSALGHEFEEGWCVRCGEAEDAWGDIVMPEECEHQFVQDGWEATCTENGYFVEKCVKCGYLVYEEMQPAFGHSFVGNECEFCGEKDIVIDEGTERVALYKYVSDELELTLYSDATSWFFVTVYTADGLVERQTGEDKWHMAEDGTIFTSVMGTEYVFVEKDGMLVII